MALGKTAKFYATHPEARKKRLAYQAAYNRKPAHRKYRSILATERKKRGLTGDPRDLSHTKTGKLVLESRKRNRQRNGHGDNGRLK